MPKYKIDFSSAKRRQKWTAWALIIVGLGLMAAAVFLWARGGQEPKPPSGAVQAAAKASTKPSQQEIAGYQVSPTFPKYINIPAIGVETARVIRLGLMANSQIAVPSDIYDTGWYDRSAKPGQSGAMFIYGHVSNWTANGVFYNLKNLKPGDKVYITRGDNKKFTYEVAASKIYNYKKVDMNAVLAPVDPKTPGLNLMTCTGQVIKGTSDFNERLVVFTKLVS